MASSTDVEDLCEELREATRKIVSDEGLLASFAPAYSDDHTQADVVCALNKLTKKLKSTNELTKFEKRMADLHKAVKVISPVINSVASAQIASAVWASLQVLLQVF